MVSESATAAAAAKPSPPPDAVSRYVLSPREARDVLALARSAMIEYGSAEDRRFLCEASVVAHDLPRPLRLAINLARLNDRLHALVIEGNVIEAGTLGDTPLHWRHAATAASRVYAFALMLYASCLGDVIAWAAQQDGRVVTDVVPTPGMEESLVSASSRRELGWHTEDAFSPYRADYVGLMCLRNPGHVPSTVACPDLSVLPADVVELLRQPRYHVYMDASHDSTAGGGEAGGHRPAPVPLLTGSTDAPVLRVDRDYASAVTGDEDAARALRSLVEHLDAATHDLPLVPGDVCFLDNRNVVHGRRPFLPSYDGRDRWLKRVNVVADLRRTRPGRTGAAMRVIG
jgi:Fe(II)/alpha-ketoglutarate-dependent arginine beta-hydroxylase